jgi:peptidyl-prolyl cis-trans isomerase B (cyclophilin B)
MGRKEENGGFVAGFRQTLAVLRRVRAKGIICWRHLEGRTGYVVKAPRPWVLISPGSPESGVYRPEAGVAWAASKNFSSLLSRRQFDKLPARPLPAARPAVVEPALRRRPEMAGKGGVVSLRSVMGVMLLVILIVGAWFSARAEGRKPVVKLETSMGEITLELYPDKAPVTVANFLQYVKDGFYNGTIFHRVIDGFMIQGGGFDQALNQKQTQAPIKNEADNGLKNEAYTIAMARTMDPDSATAQFFISVADNPRLNHTGKTPQGWGYAVFGKVMKGQDVVDKIKAVATTTRGMYQNVPVEPVTINKATVVQE